MPAAVPVPTSTWPYTPCTPSIPAPPLLLRPRNGNSFSPSPSPTCRHLLSASKYPDAALTDFDFDLYDLLGVDGSSTPSQIKLAYRSLQKRCHPDVAGSQGHDMAIILNQAYAVLSDPVSRLAYDKEQARTAELRGYTGKPLYSVWLGSESEERAVFVDEVKCVGCLKCALCAEKTFAIESVYGRARVVAQWADPEHKIQEAIDACPVDCISMVERTDLAALEFLMSKQPRGNVRVGAGNAAGARVSNIFVDVKKFQMRVGEAMNKAAATQNSGRDMRRASAIQVIRSLTDWLYWQSPISKSGFQGLSVTKGTPTSGEPNIGKLRDAADSIKAKRTRRSLKSSTKSNCSDEYWIPSRHALPPAAATQDKSTSSRTTSNAETSATSRDSSKWKRENSLLRSTTSKKPIGWSIVPTCMGVVAAALVNAQPGGGGALGELKEHVGGSLALQVVNSAWLQVALAGITWYCVGVAAVELVETIISRVGTQKK